MQVLLFHVSCLKLSRTHHGPIMFSFGQARARKSRKGGDEVCATCQEGVSRVSPFSRAVLVCPTSSVQYGLYLEAWLHSAPFIHLEMSAIII